jgi:hypothetical protein
VRVRPVARGESGTGGAEVLAFGVLVFVVGSLLVLNVWAVIDAKLAVAAAAREGARAAAESSGPSEADAAADAAEAAEASLGVSGREASDTSDGPAVSLGTSRPDGELSRCERVTVEVRHEVPTVVLPWADGWGSAVTVSARASEVVDPYRSGLAGAAECLD